MSDTVIASVIGGLALVVSTWMARRPNKTQRETKVLATKAVEQTEKTGNGFARKVTEDLSALKKSTGALHRRLDQMGEVLVNFDGRLLDLEEEDEDDNPPAPHVP